MKMQIITSSSSLGILLFLYFVNPKQFVDLIFCRTTVERKFEEETDRNEELKETKQDEKSTVQIEEINLVDTQKSQNIEIEVEEFNELKNEIQELKEKEVETKGNFDKLQMELKEIREKQEEKERKKRNKWYKKINPKSSEKSPKADKKTKDKSNQKNKGFLTYENLPSTSNV
jgi:hypothetical protein